VNNHSSFRNIFRNNIVVNNKMFHLKNKRAFIFSFEAFFSLILAMALSLGIFLTINSMDQKKTHPDTLTLLSSDVLSVLDSNDRMLNESYVANLLDTFIPGQYCVRVDVVNQNELIELSYTKLGCKDANSGSVVSKRGYLHGGKFYIARANMWYNE
jgi:hypothetical protein